MPDVKRALTIAGIVLGGLLFFAVTQFGFPALTRLRLGALMPPAPKQPATLKIPRVVVGGKLFARSSYYSDEALGLITDIQPESGGALEVVGTRGAAFLDENGRMRKTVGFARCGSEVVATELGKGKFLCRGAWGDNAVLFDGDGNTVWSYGVQGSGIDDAAPARFGGKTTGVVVGLNGGGGVRFVGADGKEVWQQHDANVWHVEVAAADENSDTVILHSNAAGQLTLRDASGNVLTRYTPEIYLSHFSLTQWHDDPNRNKLIAAADDSLYILTMRGATLVRFSAPFTAGTDDAQGTPVRFADRPVYYAALVRHNLWNRSVLYIYNEDARQIYVEVLGSDCASLRSLPDGKGSEELLVGCRGNVWKYSPKS